MVCEKESKMYGGYSALTVAGMKVRLSKGHLQHRVQVVVVVTVELMTRMIQQDKKKKKPLAQ